MPPKSCKVLKESKGCKVKQEKGSTEVKKEKDNCNPDGLGPPTTVLGIIVDDNSSSSTLIVRAVDDPQFPSLYVLEVQNHLGILTVGMTYFMEVRFYNDPMVHEDAIAVGTICKAKSMFPWKALLATASVYCTQDLEDYRRPRLPPSP